jgi:hypothetical protein
MAYGNASNDERNGYINILRENGFLHRAFHFSDMTNAVTELATIKDPNNTKNPILNVGQGGVVDSQTNAYRHAMWNAAMVSNYSEKVAIEASANHERNFAGLHAKYEAANGKTDIYKTNDFKKPNNMSQQEFIQYMDAVVDFRNNAIGRQIGKTLPAGSDTKAVASAVAKEFASKGLMVVRYDSKTGQAKIERTRITNDQLNKIETRLGQVKLKADAVTGRGTVLAQSNVQQQQRQQTQNRAVRV